MLTDADITRIVDRIVARCHPVAAGIFGSYAIGRAHAGSDLDVFVILRTPLDRGARRQMVQRALFGVLHPLDIHVFTPEEFETAANEPHSFEQVIARQARLLHGGADLERVVPSLAAAKGPTP